MAKKWTRATGIVWEELEGGALLVNAKTGARWSLNATAAALWAWCDGCTSLNDLAVRLSQSSRRTLRQARAEVRSFYALLAAQNLLAVTNSHTSLPHQNIFFSALNAPANLHSLGLGHGPRTRPGPRGNSSPG